MAVLISVVFWNYFFNVALYSALYILRSFFTPCRYDGSKDRYMTFDERDPFAGEDDDYAT